MKNFFDIVAPIYGKFSLRATISQFKKYITFNSTDAILDLGGGNGRVAAALAHLVKSVAVVDSSEEMIKVCKRHNKLECIQATADTLPFPDNYFDKIIVVDAFHHFSGVAKVISEMERVLKEGGNIIIEEYNPITWWGKWIICIEKIWHLGSSFYTPVQLLGKFTAAGFLAQIHNEGKKKYYLVAKK